MKRMFYLKNVTTLKLADDRCTGCGQCLEVCPQAVLYPVDGRVGVRDRDACMECGACSRNCPTGAIVDELLECISQVDASFIVVTNEVGLGLVPANKIGRLYRDLLGRANQMLAERADEVYLMVAGLPVPIKSARLF